MQTYKIESRNLEKPLLAVLADLEELWPEEIHIADYVEVSCASQRAGVAVGALIGEEVGEDDQLTHVLEERTYLREQARLQPSVPDPKNDLKSSSRICEVCGTQYQANRTNQKFCSKKCAKYNSNHRYLDNLKQRKNGGSTAAQSADPWLDQQSGEILDIQTINQRMLDGTYKPGKRFVRSGNRIYIVEKTLKPSGLEKFRLKRIYE